MRVVRWVWMAMLLAAAATAARADVLFDLQYGAGDVEGGVTFTTVPTAVAGEYEVTAVNGYFEVGNYGSPASYQITGLLPVGAYQNNDNLVFFPGPNGWFDGSGVSWTLDNGSFQNVSSVVYDGVLGYQYTTNFIDPFVGGYYGDGLDEVWFTEETPTPPVATPEPGTMGLVGTGLLGVVGMVRRRVRGGVR